MRTDNKSEDFVGVLCCEVKEIIGSVTVRTFI